MAHSGISDLPEELLLRVFEYLDSSPPSERKKRQEPSFDLVKTLDQPLKQISLICQRWRRIVLPLLFRDACIRIDMPKQPHWKNCKACNNASGRYLDLDDRDLRNIDRCHIDMVRDFQRRPSQIEIGGQDRTSRASLSTTTESFEYPNEAATASWAWRFHHVVTDFCAFVRSHSLGPAIQSVCVFSKKMLSGKLARFPHESKILEWRYPAAAAFWMTLFNTICPDRVVIMAPPTELAFLANAAVDTYGDWAFADMDYHIFELRCDKGSRRPVEGQVDYAKLRSYPRQFVRIPESSVLFMRDWIHLDLNEGSFLKAYGTYEYFERGPPSIVHSLSHSLLPNLSHNDELGCPALMKCRSMTYTAIFPFHSHASFDQWWMGFEELDLQLAPDPKSDILDDKARIGKADLQDCWSELVTFYRALSRNLARSDGRRPHKFRKLVCRDFQIPMLADELDEIFVPLCLPTWVESPHGTFLNTTPSSPDAENQL